MWEAEVVGTLKPTITYPSVPLNEEEQKWRGEWGGMLYYVL